MRRSTAAWPATWCRSPAPPGAADETQDDETMDMGVLWGYIVYAKANSQQTLTDSVSRRPVPALYVDMRRVGSGWVSDRGLPLSVGEPYSAGGGVTSSPLSP